MLAVHAYRTRQKNRYRREALGRLKEIASRRDEPGVPGEIALLLKRTALAVYPRAQVAHLYGADWARFLCKSTNDDSRVKKAAPDLAAAAYRNDVEGAALIKPAKRWIKVHRA